MLKKRKTKKIIDGQEKNNIGKTRKFVTGLYGNLIRVEAVKSKEDWKKMQ